MKWKILKNEKKCSKLFSTYLNLLKIFENVKNSQNISLGKFMLVWQASDE